MNSLTFMTGNQNKADFLAEHIGIDVTFIKLDLDEIQSLDLHTVVEHKATQAFAHTNSPVLVEDAALVLPALGRLPGTYIKWFLEELGRNGLLDLANRLSDQTAIGHVCYGLYDGSEVRYFDGEMRGTIAERPGHGTRGFGFDAIFINEGFDITRSEMSEADYNRTSYRTEAIIKLKEFLTNEPNSL